MRTKGAADSAVLRDPIAITGIGLLAAGANAPEELWENARLGRSPGQVRQFEENLPPLAVCSIRDPLPKPLVRLRRVHRADRVNRLSLAAGLRAWDNSGLEQAGLPASEIAVIIGTSRGPFRKWLEAQSSPNAKLLPSLAADSTYASLHGGLAATIGAEGPAYTVSTACASGAHAIALAADHLAGGSATCALVGGVDAPLHPLLLGQFLATGILDLSLPPDLVCRPFDQSAGGTLLGEAGAFLVLETLHSAQARKAKIHGLLVGWGLAADGKSTSAESAGANALAGAVQRALARCGHQPKDFGYLNLHGTGTRKNDDLELAWLKNFLPADKIVAYSSTKAVTGHCLGATPVLEAIICLEALRIGVLPPSAHCRTPHSAAPPGLVLEPNQPLARPLVLSTSLGFWGACAALVFTAAPEA
jgi:3-oxoacyl-(acyl-carrier-protein) synthase